MVNDANDRPKLTLPKAMGSDGVHDGVARDGGGDSSPTPGSSPHRVPRIGIWGLVSLPFVVLLAIVAWVALSHTPIPMPAWAMAQMQSRANVMLADRLRLDVVGQSELIIDRGLIPKVVLRGVRVARADGRPLALFPELRIGFGPEALMRGRLEPQSFTVSGARIALRRLSDGSIDFDLGGGGDMPSIDFSDPAQITAAIETAFETPLLRSLQTLTAEGVHVRIDDRRLDRVWEVDGGQFRLDQTADDIALNLGFSISDGDRAPSVISLTASTSKQGPEAEFVASFDNMPAADLAMQSPAVAMLGVLDAPISGRLHAAIDAAGKLTATAAELNIGKGAIQPIEGAPPVPFDRAKARVSYDSGARKLVLEDAEFQSKALRFHAQGQSYLRDFVNGLPREALVQLNLSDIEADPEGIFESPARFAFGAVEGRVRLTPFTADIGQIQLVGEGKRITAHGRVSASAAGWTLAVDAGIGQIDQHDLLALWPPKLVPPTRSWIAGNVETGQLHNARAAIRIAPGTEPRFELGYEFRGAEVTILNTLPPVQGGRGFATIHDNTHALLVEEGRITAPSGGQVEVADSLMRVPDIREKPARAEITLVTRSDIPAALSILDQPPFEFLRKAGKGIDLATGRAEAHVDLCFALEKKIDAKDVDFNVTARLNGVRSEDKVVPKRVLTAPELILRADRTGMTISGKGMLDAAPFDGRWSQLFGAEHAGHSRIDGYANVTPKSLESLGVNLPSGMLTGSGWAKIGVDLIKDQPAQYEFRTDLKGIGLSIPEIAWSKPEAPEGDLYLTGKLSQPPTVDRITLTAPGLTAAGALTLDAAGLRQALFDQLVIGNWFKGGVKLAMHGAGTAPDVTVTGGTLDLRHAPFGKEQSGGKSSGTASKSAPSSQVNVTLDRLVVSDGIALTSLRGNFTTRGGFAGDFASRLNDHAQLEGVIGPAANGRTAVRITSPDAGAVLASAGITDKAAGGDLILTLSPVGEQSYDGTATARGLRITDAPVLASMLSAVSIIGLVEQLQGDGIVFSDVDAAFRLTPDGVSIKSAEATGASMGVTLKGNFLTKSGQMDLEGVVSPFYLLNSIGQIFSRKGEGLFGFTYAVQGPIKNPRVSVNPFSILTPGGLRDIFRHDPPQMRAK